MHRMRQHRLYIKNRKQELPPVLNLREVSHTFEQVIIEWDANEAGSYDVYYGIAPLPAPDETTIPIVTIGVENCTINALDASTDYEFYVRSSGDGITGVWSAALEVTTSDIIYLDATGGTITTDGDYRIHTFTGTSSIVINQLAQFPADNNIEYLIQAGGAGGSGGGGGAGGSLTGLHNAALGSFAVVVGAGGAGATGNAYGGTGSNSSVFALVALGGGGGGFIYPGANGGCGGGAGLNGNYAGGIGSQGFNGGNNTSISGGGGGGGTDQAGLSVAAGSIGGAGKLFYGVYYGGGGGGGNNTLVNGGLGGGGKGAGSIAAGTTAGSPNTGGGGGGIRSSLPAAAGGSGIVILRYKYK